MTNPYSGGPVRYMRIPSQQATIARLPIILSNVFVFRLALFFKQRRGTAK